MVREREHGINGETGLYIKCKTMRINGVKERGIKGETGLYIIGKKMQPA